MAKFGINDILNAKTKAAGQQAQGYKEIYLSPYEVKAAEENTHQKLEGIEELADSFLHVGQEQPTVLAKLDTLKEAEKQVQEQFENGEVSEEQYRALQREIASTEIKLGDLEQQAQESNKELEGVADAADDTAEKVSKIDAAANALDTVSNKAGAAAKALAPVSAGAAAVGAASYAAAMDIDNGYDIVITKTGATGEALENLQGSMENIFTSLPIDAETAGTAIGEVNTRFQLTGEELEKLSQQFIEFSEINDTEIAIYDYGVSASKKRAVFDEQGNHFYRDNYYVGKIGTNQWVDNNAHKGLVFDLETQGKYMAWAQKPTEGASSYTTILCYSRANSIFTQAGLHLGCNMYGHGWILDNVDLRNCSANGYTTFTGTLPVVLEIHKTDNNGGIGWTYGNVYIKNGLITSIPQ